MTDVCLPYVMVLLYSCACIVAAMAFTLRLFIDATTWQRVLAISAVSGVGIFHGSVIVATDYLVERSERNSADSPVQGTSMKRVWPKGVPRVVYSVADGALAFWSGAGVVSYLTDGRLHTSLHVANFIAACVMALHAYKWWQLTRDASE